MIPLPMSPTVMLAAAAFLIRRDLSCGEIIIGLMIAIAITAFREWREKESWREGTGRAVSRYPNAVLDAGGLFTERRVTIPGPPRAEVRYWAHRFEKDGKVRRSRYTE